MLKKFWEKFIYEGKRLRVETIVVILSVAVFWIVGISRTNFETIIFKLAVVAAASAVAHVSRQLIFEYVSLESCIFGKDRFADVPVPIRATVAAGIFMTYVAIILGVVFAA